MISLKKEMNESSPSVPTAIYNVDGPNISRSEILNVAAGVAFLYFRT